MEEYTIEARGGRDYVESIEDFGEIIILNFAKKTDDGVDINKIEVPKKILAYVSDFIGDLPVGQKSSIIELSEAFVEHFKIKSSIVQKRMYYIKDAIKRILELDDIRANYVMEELQNNHNFMKMDWIEIIGMRLAKKSYYFKLWASLRFFAEQNKIKYLKSGNFWREI